MPKLPECERCVFCAHDLRLVCALHPFGVEGNTCVDFQPNPALENQQFLDFLDIFETFENPYTNSELEWEPVGASYYNGELIIQPHQRWTREEQLALIDWHPIFTGKCPECGASFDKYDTNCVHWDCPNSDCGWMDDTL